MILNLAIRKRERKAKERKQMRLLFQVYLIPGDFKKQ